MNTYIDRPMSVTAEAYIPIRPDLGGHLTVENVKRARWNLPPGCSVRISIYGLSRWDGGVPELIGRFLGESGVADVKIQASARPALLQEFTEAIVNAVETYRAVVRVL